MICYFDAIVSLVLAPSDGGNHVPPPGPTREQIQNTIQAWESALSLHPQREAFLWGSQQRKSRNTYLATPSLWQLLSGTQSHGNQKSFP